MTVHSLVIQKLLSTNAHLGHHIAAHHFKIFTYGARNGTAIIDSDKTLICLRSACDFIGSLARQKAQFMFVNTNSLYDEIFDQMTKKIGYKYDNKWRVGGFLTNSLSPKKFRSRNKKISFSPARLPDCLVIVDTERKSSIIAEADKLQIPIVALVDSTMPSEVYNKITYPVPAKDSVQFVYLFCNLITKTFLLEQKRSGARSERGREEVGTQQLASPTTGEDVQLVQHSKADNAENGVLVVPYESLAPISNDPAETKQLLDNLLVLQLNDGLGTKMGFNGSKSTIEVCDGVNFLDLIINQIESLNSKYGCNIPLLLMNTVKTHDDTQKVLDKYSKANIDIHTFTQSQHPQVKDFEGSNSENDLYQSDHGALFSLMSSGTLDVLLRQGKEYILIITADNMATVVDPKILNHLLQNKIECCMEVTPTTLLDLKDRSSISQGKRIQLAEIARFTPKHQMEKFKFIDTKNMWVNLNAIKGFVETEALRMRDFPNVEEKDGNKTLIQETAIGSALRLFDHAVGINVPQSRFLPLEATSNLLLLQSDLYAFTEGYLVRNQTRKNPVDPSIELGPEFNQVNDFLSRFKSIPSIIELDSLKVTGDVWFGSGITLKGKVSIAAKPWMRIEIPDGAILENKVINGPGDI